jgi:hypothetical protein
VVAGLARAADGTSRCFAFVRTRAFLCSHYVQDAVAGVGGDLHHVTVLTDGDVVTPSAPLTGAHPVSAPLHGLRAPLFNSRTAPSHSRQAL